MLPAPPRRTSTACSPGARPRCCRCRRSPRDPTPRPSPAGASGRSPATRRGMAEQLVTLSASGHSVTLCTSSPMAASRLADVLAGEGVTRPRSRLRPTPPPGISIVVAPLSAGLRPRRARTGGPRRVRHHRPAHAAPPAEAPGATDRRVLRRPRAGQLRRAPPARRGPLRGGDHAHRRRRDPRLPPARVPGERPPLPARRPDRGAHPVLGGRGPHARPRWAGRTGSAPGPRPGPPPARSPRSWSSSTGRRASVAGHAFSPDTPWQQRARGRLPLHRDPRPAARDRRRQGRHGVGPADGPPRLRRRRLRQDRGRDPRGVQGGPGRQAGGGPRADDAAREPALRDVLGPLSRLPGARRAPQPVPLGRAGDQGRRRAARRVGRCRHRHPPPARGGHRLQEARAARRRRGAALRRHPQGGGEGDEPRRRRAHHDRQPHPAHPRDGAHRHPGPVDGQHAPERPPADPHLRRRGGRVAPSPRPSGASCCARARSSTSTTGWPTSRPSRARCVRSCPRRASRWRMARWTRAPWSRWSSTSGTSATTSWCAPPSSSRASTCRPSTPSSWTGPICSVWGSSTRSAAGSAGPATGRTRTCSTRPSGC